MTDAHTTTAPYVMAPMATHMLDLLGWRGFPVKTVLARAGVSREALSPADGRTPMEMASRVIHAALAESGDPQLYLHLSRDVAINGFGAVGFMAQSSATLKDSLDRVIRFAPLMGNIGHSTLEYEPGQVVWTINLDYDDDVVRRQAAELLVGVAYRFLLLVQAERADIVREFRFAHRAPRDARQLAAYAEVLQRPVHFGARAHAIVMNPSALAWPLRQPDVVLRDAVELQAERQLQALSTPEYDLRGTVKLELERLVRVGQASREALAERMGVSSRHLARQLANAGMSYRALVDGVRRDIACDQLRSSVRSVAQIGRQLGFSDNHSFIRWFRNESGMSPCDFRQREGQAADLRALERPGVS